MKASWLLNRLSVMTPAELIFRFRRAIWISIEHLAILSGWQPSLDSDYSRASDVLLPVGIDVPSMKNGFRSSAGDLSRGVITLFEYHQLEVGRPVRWHRDPLTLVEHDASSYGKTIDYRDERKVGNIKVVWELGRHQFCVPIAIQYALDRDEKHLVLLAELIGSWIDQNPFGRGIHWCSSLEVSLRAMSWSVTHQILRYAGLEQGMFSLQLNEETLKRSIYQHAWFIRHFLSLHSSGNNHLIGELTGLFVVTSVFPMGGHATGWQRFAWKSLLEQSEIQVHEDGVGKEQAVYYHAWVLEYFIISYKTAIDAGFSVPSHFFDTIIRMARYLADLTPDHETTEPPQIGDADDGVALSFTAERSSSYYLDLIQTAACLAGDSSVGTTTPKARWYKSMGSGAPPKGAQNLIRPAYPVSYDGGGYAILGQQDFHLVFDAGSLGYPAIAAHGHADALSISLAVDKRWWLIDPGTYAYHSSTKWRDYFRGTAAHNTIRLNGVDQSLSGGPFLWLKHASTVRGIVDCDKSSGIQRTSGKILKYHGAEQREAERSLAVNPDKYTIEVMDRVSCRNETTVTRQFHFASDISVELVGTNRCVATRPGSHLQMILEFSGEGFLKVYHGSEKPIYGWYSPALGKKQPCWTLVAESKIYSSASFGTVIRIIGKR